MQPAAHPDTQGKSCTAKAGITAKAKRPLQSKKSKIYMPRMPKCEKSAYIWNGETNNDTRSQTHNKSKKMNRKRIFATGCLCALFGATLLAQSVPAAQVFAGYL